MMRLPVQAILRGYHQHVQSCSWSRNNNTTFNPTTAHTSDQHLKSTCRHYHDPLCKDGTPERSVLLAKLPDFNDAVDVS
jgi:hypothetical protein